MAGSSYGEVLEASNARIVQVATELVGVSDKYVFFANIL
jgi:hypothetical protein